ncbi:MAG: hypothetical protein WDZ26_02660 [Nitriliruptoraceae bacterium]
MEPSAHRDVSEPTSGVVPVDLRDWVVFDAAHARRVRVFETSQLALDLWCLEPGQATPPLHLPAQDVAYAVIAGRAWFVTDDGEVGLDPMGGLLVPAGTVHGFDNRAPDPLIVFASSAPPTREGTDPPSTTTADAVIHQETGMLRRAWESVLGVRGTTT